MDDLDVSSVRAATDVLDAINGTDDLDGMDVLRHDARMSTRQQLAALLGVHLLVLLVLVAGAVA